MWFGYLFEFMAISQGVVVLEGNLYLKKYGIATPIVAQMP